MSLLKPAIVTPVCVPMYPSASVRKAYPAENRPQNAPRQLVAKSMAEFAMLKSIPLGRTGASYVYGAAIDSSR
ncbi:MAG: hypothetical protein HC769_14775 [Cyanobacteria bacterium CRU_2_1]|nr:hypothetical protein [Cyanobacteria bacterium RU_5_0]NJR59985.1 hypothetical protein [Cyanobacteria bacterium CRU_2_1]